MEATLNHPEGSPEPPRHWAWTLWTAKIPVPRGAQQVEIWSKVMFIFNPTCTRMTKTHSLGSMAQLLKRRLTLNGIGLQVVLYISLNTLSECLTS